MQKKSCKYCKEAHTNCLKQDCYGRKILSKELPPMFGTFLRFDVGIDNSGKMFFGYLNNTDFVEMGKKKIKYCPMCGSEIPEKTPTDKAWEELCNE